MAATKISLNWTGVSYTPAAGTLTAITKVTSMEFNFNGSLIHFKGDDDRYPTVIANADNEPSVSVTSGDVKALYSISPGTVCTVVGTLQDALKAAGGDITFTASNAVFSSPNMNASHGSFASASASWSCFSSDGQAPPIVLS